MRNISPASKNPFEELAALYSAKASVRKRSVFPSTAGGYISEIGFVFDVTLALLPNQIFMFPEKYSKNITNSSEITDMGLELYDDEHLKYNFTFLRIFINILFFIFYVHFSIF